MKNRTPFCIYCNQRMESQTSKKKFCSDKCRVYFHRKFPNGNIISPVELEKRLKEAKIKPIEDVLEENRITCPILEEKPVIELKNDNPEPPLGLSGIDLAIWKSENWK